MKFMQKHKQNSKAIQKRVIQVPQAMNTISKLAVRPSSMSPVHDSVTCRMSLGGAVTKGRQRCEHFLITNVT